MKAVCEKCGRTAEGEGIAFCQYCGGKLKAADIPGNPQNPEAAQWIERALREQTLPKRKAVLDEARKLFPDDRDIARELLFIGKPVKNRRDGDFFIIKSYLLQFYRKPAEFPENMRAEMRRELFEGEELQVYLAGEGNPRQAMEDYLCRICREYIEIFLEGDSKVMGSIFGFRLERAPEKAAAKPAAEMIVKMKADGQLHPEQREMLWQAMYRAFAERYAGKTEHLDALLP